jgi:hypothetical protein
MTIRLNSDVALRAASSLSVSLSHVAIMRTLIREPRMCGVALFDTDNIFFVEISSNMVVNFMPFLAEISWRRDVIFSATST